MSDVQEDLSHFLRDLFDAFRGIVNMKDQQNLLSIPQFQQIDVISCPWKWLTVSKTQYSQCSTSDPQSPFDGFPLKLFVLHTVMELPELLKVMPKGHFELNMAMESMHTIWRKMDAQSMTKWDASKGGVAPGGYHFRPYSLDFMTVWSGRCRAEHKKHGNFFHVEALERQYFELQLKNAKDFGLVICGLFFFSLYSSLHIIKCRQLLSRFYWRFIRCFLVSVIFAQSCWSEKPHFVSETGFLRFLYCSLIVQF